MTNLFRKLFLFASIISLTISSNQNLFGQWVQVHDPLQGGVSCFSVIGTHLLAGSYEGVFLSTDSGTLWDSTSLSGAYAFAVNGENLFVASNGVSLSIDSGATWTMIDGEGYLMAEMSEYSLAAIGSNLVAGTNGWLYLSTDGGTIWMEADTSLPKTNFNALIANGSNLFAGTPNGIFLSTDSGATWAATSVVGIEHPIVALATIGTNLFAAMGGGGVVLSTNNGDSWTTVNTGLTDTFVTCLAVSGTNLFTGTENGGEVFLSTDSGANWTNVGNDISGLNGLPNTFVTALTTFGPFLFAGTSDSGIWRRPLSEMIGSSSVAESQKTSPEIQCFPNPFSQSTTINFSSTESGPSQITIVNLLGQQITQLFDGELGAGEHSFVWDASGEPAGTYFCVFRMNGTVQPIPMVLTR